MPESAIVILPEVRAAIDSSRPVVALESAVLTHGLPRTPAGFRPEGSDEAFDPNGPLNREVARLMERVVRSRGAVPATMAVIDGRMHIGLTGEEVDRLAADRSAIKASVRELPLALVKGQSAGLTVAGVLQVCTRIDSPIRVFATGGIGGVHPGFAESLDISADLTMLARADVCVVCAGAKSLLDLSATIEALETLSVNVVGFRTDLFPRFVTRADASLRVPARLDTVDDIAGLCRARWSTVAARGAVVVTNPLPDDRCLEEGVFNAAMAEASRRAREHGVAGASLTPFLLDAISELTGGRSCHANVALLASNAALAAEIACAMSKEASMDADSHR